MFCKTEEITAEMLYEHLLKQYGRCCGLCKNAANFVDPLKCATHMKCLKKGVVLFGEKAMYNKLSCFERKYK